jgi:hypothetical protein
MLWEVRANLIKKHGFAPGNSLALQLVTDGLKLSPPNPNWVQARDAILLADRVLTGGANETELWAAFAKRGLGYSAKAPPSYGNSGLVEACDLIPVLAVERFEIQGGNGNGIIEAGEDNNLEIHVANHSTVLASQVVGQLSCSVTGVSLPSNLAYYTDVPAGQTRTNLVPLTLRTASDFVEGRVIDLLFTVQSAQTSVTNTLRLYTGVPGSAVLFGDYANFTVVVTNAAEQGLLTPRDLGSFQPLGMSDDGKCLLWDRKARSIIWEPPGTVTNEFNCSEFIPHRITRDGKLVGRMIKSPTTNYLTAPDGTVFTNIAPHSCGFVLDFGKSSFQFLPTNDYAFFFPANVSNKAEVVGVAFKTNGTIAPIFFVSAVSNDFPTLHDVYDMNSNGVAVGTAAIYLRPVDQDGNGKIDVVLHTNYLSTPNGYVEELVLTNEINGSVSQCLYFNQQGKLNWYQINEWGETAGFDPNLGPLTTTVYYSALSSSAGQFNTDGTLRWLGPLTFDVNYSSLAGVSIALLINDQGTVAGYSALDTGDPAIDAFIPTHAFRCQPTNGAFALISPILSDLGVLPGGIHSFPRDMTPKGEVVGYSDFGLVPGNGVSDLVNLHAVYWPISSNAPQDLGSMGPLPQIPLQPVLPYGYSDAYGINQYTNVAGTSVRCLYKVQRTNTWIAWAEGILQTNTLVVDTNVFVIQTNDCVVSTNLVAVGVRWQLNHKLQAENPTEPVWEITDLNQQLVSTPNVHYHITHAVDLNDDNWILAHAQADFYDPNGTWIRGENRAVLLVPIEVHLRDRLLAGSIQLPQASCGLRVVNETTEQTLVDIPNLATSDSVYASEKAMMEADEQEQDYVFYRDESHPNTIRFSILSRQLGKVRVEILRQGKVVAQLNREFISDPEFRDFLVFADERIDKLVMPDLTTCVDEQMQDIGEGLFAPGICSYQGSPLAFSDLEELPDNRATNLFLFQASVGISRNHGVPAGSRDALAAWPLNLKHPQQVAKSCESLVAATGRYSLVVGTGLVSGTWDGVKGDVDGMVFGWKFVLNSFTDFKGRCNQVREIAKELGKIQIEEIPSKIASLAGNLWQSFKSKADKETQWTYQGHPAKDPVAIYYYTMSYGSGYGGEQIVVASLTAGMLKYGTIGKVLAGVVNGPLDVCNWLSGAKKLKGAFTRYFSQSTDCEGSLRALNKVGNVLEQKYKSGPHVRKTPGQVLEDKLEQLGGSHDRLMKEVRESEELAHKVATKDPEWPQHAGQALKRTADIIGELETLGQEVTEKALLGFVRVYDLIALLPKKPKLDKDGYELLVKILKRNAELEQKSLKEVLEGVADASKSAYAWDFPWFTRGLVVEARVAHGDYAKWTHVGKEMGGKFETFDFNNGNRWVSLKSCDTSSPTALRRMKDEVDKLAWAKNANPRFEIALDIRVPPWYNGELQGIFDYAKQNKIGAKVVIYP